MLQKMGYYIWGIHDKTHEITGTDFDQDQEMGREPLKHWLSIVDALFLQRELKHLKY